VIRHNTAGKTRAVFAYNPTKKRIGISGEKKEGTTGGRQWVPNQSERATVRNGPIRKTHQEKKVIVIKKNSALARKGKRRGNGRQRFWGIGGLTKG